MIDRYADPRIDELFSDLHKLLGWDESELAVIHARALLDQTRMGAYTSIRDVLKENPPDVAWWRAKDADIGHDLNAYIEERRQHVPVEYQAEFHRDTTSYDTEEPHQALTLIRATSVVEDELRSFLDVLYERANNWRYLVMLGRTHGQGAKLRSFGGRILTWAKDIKTARHLLAGSVELCRHSRISGAIGTYGGNLSPELERTALQNLGLNPYVGATQITPRIIYANLAQNLYLLCAQLGKAALDIRLSARSGLPLCHEPFRKRQKGSSAMPHKKNTILTEQMQGMVRMASKLSAGLAEGIETWEERSIEQSCVERVFWPELFHVTIRMITVMRKVVDGLVVYPDHMLQEIVESRGTYASDDAKNFLAEEFGKLDVPAEDAYRVVQLAAFCVLSPTGFWNDVRRQYPTDLEGMDHLLQRAHSNPPAEPVSIQDLIPDAKLRQMDDLDFDWPQVRAWNDLLGTVFSTSEVRARWNILFNPSYQLKGEQYFFEQIVPKK